MAAALNGRDDVTQDDAHRNTTNISYPYIHVIHKRLTRLIIYSVYVHVYNTYNIRLRYCLNRERRVLHAYIYNNNTSYIIIGLSRGHIIRERKASCFRLSPLYGFIGVCVYICILYLRARREVPPATDKTPAERFRYTAIRCRYILYSGDGTVVGKTRNAKLSNASAAVRGGCNRLVVSLYPLFSVHRRRIEFIIVEQYNHGADTISVPVRSFI